MKSLKDIRQDLDLLNAINWEMTPEEAVTLYLEWGNNWARSNYVIRSKDDVAHYFMISTWKGRPVIYLIRRNSQDTEELARILMPRELEQEFMEEIGHNKGVYAVDGKVRNWLQKELAV